MHKYSYFAQDTYHNATIDRHAALIAILVADAQTRAIAATPGPRDKRRKAIVDIVRQLPVGNHMRMSLLYRAEELWQ